MVFQGPTRPGTSVSIFRATGRSVPKTPRRGGGSFSGPVRPGRDEKIFRETGRSVPSGSIEAKRISGELVKAEAERIAVERKAEAIREQKRKAEARRLELIEEKRVVKKFSLLSRKKHLVLSCI